jgi:hypothetical protein
VANHGFSGYRERGLDEVKEQNLVIRSQSKSKRTSTRAILESAKFISYNIVLRGKIDCQRNLTYAISLRSFTHRGKTASLLLNRDRSVRVLMGDLVVDGLTPRWKSGVARRRHSRAHPAQRSFTGVDLISDALPSWLPMVLKY